MPMRESGPTPLALSLTKRSRRRQGFDKLSPNGDLSTPLALSLSKRSRRSEAHS